ncbi:MAG: class I SAM-dependent methyltransferase [Rhizobiaceae bacterium]|nr:class I SAM-dependent methyltransferase [Hyphomicrobiales bacterium]NRB30218.1 class I SAM-dependent methyltransferase [Rhizobiaceae bacterium]
MWDQRYDRPDYLFGTKPADFLVRQADRIPSSSNILCVADGEGRNSVYLAELGHRVTAFDASQVAIAKAHNLAQSKNASVQFKLSGVEDWDWSIQYDAVVAIFIQFAPPKLRQEIFANVMQAVRPGGLLLLHGYAPRQVDYGTGGPAQAEHMYTVDLLAQSFAELELLRLEDYDAEIDEGPGHSGLSGLVDLVGRKTI